MGKRFVIVGTSVYGIENMGDEALLTVLVRELKRAAPGCYITWVARHKNETLAREYGIDEVILGLEHETKAASNGRWFNGLNRGDDTIHLKLLAERIAGADALIIGGDPFQQITLSFNRGLSPYAANLITLGKFLGTKTVLYSIHMGSVLTDAYAKELTKFCIENADLTLLREQFSLDVINEMRIDSSGCRVVADSAWGLIPKIRNVSLFEILPNFDKGWLDQRILGVNIRHNYWQWSEEKWGRISSEFAKFLDVVVEKHAAKILFIPNCTYDVDHVMEDDRASHAGIALKMKHSSCTYQITQKLSLDQTLSIFPNLWAHVSNRRHSAVFAAVHRLPVLPLGGSWHVRPAFEEIGLGMNFIEPEFWTSWNLNKSFADVLSAQAVLQQTYEKKLPLLNRLACSQGDYIAEL